MLIGETTDREEIEVILRNKLGEAYPQEELSAQFNKLYVSGSFIYFELIPDDAEEVMAEHGGTYMAEGVGIPLNIRPENPSEDFDKVSVPSKHVGIYVCAIENGQIYDLSSVGYRIIGQDVMYMDNEVVRVALDGDEMVATPVFTDFQKERIITNSYYEPAIIVDKYGNVFLSL